jgi:hypothetical protein
MNCHIQGKTTHEKLDDKYDQRYQGMPDKPFKGIIE